MLSTATHMQPNAAISAQEEQTTSEIVSLFAIAKDKCERVEPGSPGNRQCTSVCRDGSRCKKSPIHGLSVCELHGGLAPSAKLTAQKRLLAAVGPAIATLIENLTCGEPAQEIAAAKAILDRAGFGPSSTLVFENPSGSLRQLSLEQLKDRMRQLDDHITQLIAHPPLQLPDVEVEASEVR